MQEPFIARAARSRFAFWLFFIAIGLNFFMIGCQTPAQTGTKKTDQAESRVVSVDPLGELPKIPAPQNKQAPDLPEPRPPASPKGEPFPPVAASPTMPLVSDPDYLLLPLDPATQLPGAGLPAKIPAINIAEFVAIDIEYPQAETEMLTDEEIPGQPEEPVKQAASRANPRTPQAPLPSISEIDQQESASALSPATPQADPETAPTFRAAPSSVVTQPTQQSEPATVASSRSTELATHYEVFVGELWPIDLPGPGWSYLGSQPQSKSVAQISKTSDREYTNFSFRFTEIGQFDLLFQQQDLLKGVNRKTTVTVIVTLKNSSRSTASIAPASLAFLPKETHSPPALPSEAQTGPQMAAAPTWISEAELIALAQKALEKEEIEFLAAHIQKLLACQNPPEYRFFLDLAALLGRDQRYAEAVSLLKETERLFAGQTSLDELYFRLARLQENEASPIRNIKAAISNYNKIIKNFPASVWRQEAEDRQRYLNRYYIDIR